MVDCLDIQLAGPMASVAIVDTHLHDAPVDQASQLEMQKLLDAELAEFRIARQALAEAQTRFTAIQEQFFGEAEEQLLDLSLEIARKVLAQEIKAERHDVDPIVREALSRIPDCRDVVVHLHPDDLARCEMALNDQGAADFDGVKFTPDPQIGRGDCLVKTARGTVESSIDKNLSEISRALKGPE